MAISVTEILGTDSLAGSRIVINDNFNIIVAEINDIEVYFNPTAGTISNLANLTTAGLKVGLTSTKLEITNSVFNIISDVIQSGSLDLRGNFYLNNVDPDILDETFLSPSLAKNIGSSTAVPTYAIERVSNSGSSPVVLTLFDGEIGQTLEFFYSDTSSGDVHITADASTDLLIPTGNTYINLNSYGHSVSLRCIPDASGNPVWAINGGNSYTFG
jgi:hypothetical protein